ncbi:hypothetical protein J7I93_01770 [Bacillus sp. ISL-47]|uniref:hypothetical protein n=1 Tax=Bacillus sp. ISL-47 TaxID=2819130 RepID=UPI001BE9E815|nr:hypothetical protein [Bacillus sp. ISL-47]MBT2686903.1 hypothetical protein [Bacillus sp. ISL-47]MBT2710442.1 hypothetical protein [Pseudomonas sp. ISL-84]
MRKYLFIMIAALMLLSFINHRSIYKAVQLCEDGKGTPQVQKDIFAFNWSVGCEL